MVNRIEEKRVNYNYGRKAGAPAQKKKTLADIMKAGRREANAAKRSAAETQEFLKWALQNCKNQGDLEAIRDLVNSNGTASQRKAFEKMEYDLAKPAKLLHREKQKMYNQLFGYGNGKHPSNTPLGTAQPTSSRGMTWTKYAQEHGGTYTRPFSDVAHADRLAEEAIARNARHNEMQKVYEELFKDAGEKPPVITEPPIEKPPVVEPPIEKPPVEKPPVAEPPIEKPPVSEPPVNKPPKGPKAKVKGFKLGKKGKFALAALAVGLIGAGIAYLAKSKKATTPPDTITTPVTRNRDPKQAVPMDTIEAKVVSEIPRDTESGKYIVKKGDNCWNIALAELIKENSGEIPSDKEVIERTEQIIKRNTLHYEKDNYTVLIYPNDTLKIDSLDIKM